MKKIVIVGTDHRLQGCDRQFERIIGCLLTKHGTQLILEEWDLKENLCPELMRTVGRRIAESRNLKWENIGTPSEGIFATNETICLADGERSIPIETYGPISNQANRELWMTNKIVQLMDGFSNGLFVCGQCHVQSMAEKLTVLAFDVSGYIWPVQIT